MSTNRQRKTGRRKTKKQHVCFRFHTFLERFSRWIKPPTIFLVFGTFAELLAENALLRQQLIILRLIASVSIVRNITFLRWVCSYLFDSKEATIRWFSKICAEEGSSHMKSQYGSPSQAAAPALEYVGVGRRLLAPIIDGI